MTSVYFYSRILSVWLTVALLAGCAGSQLLDQTDRSTVPSGTAINGGSTPQNSANLVYAAGKGTSYVLSYSDGHLVGTINQGAVAACSDKHGNVFLIGSAGAVEYQHGGTRPIQTLVVPGYAAACAIDPTTGNLAVLFFGSTGNVEYFLTRAVRPRFIERALIQPSAAMIVTEIFTSMA